MTENIDLRRSEKDVSSLRGDHIKKDTFKQGCQPTMQISLKFWPKDMINIQIMNSNLFSKSCKQAHVRKFDEQREKISQNKEWMNERMNEGSKLFWNTSGLNIK